MMAFDKSKLFVSRLPEMDVEIPGIGTVRIRSLSRSEVLELKGVDIDVAVMERKLLSVALLDPVLTVEEVAEWQAASAAGELEPVTAAIMEISGLVDATAKQAMTQFR